MKNTILTWSDTQGLCLEIARQLQQSNWIPEYVVGITRGGCVPAVLISQYLNVRCEMVKVSLRDGGNTESNCWMAEDSFGYNQIAPTNILIVDDINDSGATLEWIKNDWKSSCLPNDPAWNTIWGTTTRTACLVNNTASSFSIDYSGMDINKLDEDTWIVFPWENWWKQ
jgi:hypoxanthine phosphoribosyltransferase